MKPDERVEITDEHLIILRERYKECEGMTDGQIIEALHLYENRGTILHLLCYPTFDTCLFRIKNKK